MTEVLESPGNKKQSKTKIYILAALVIFNIVAYNLLMKTGGYDGFGNYVEATPINNLKTSLVANLFGIPLLCALLSLLVACIPYKGFEFQKKYSRSFIYSLLGINSISTLGLIGILVLTLLGSYPPPAMAQQGISKEQAIAQFKSEIKALSDSSLYYINYATASLEKGGDAVTIGKEVAPKLKWYESQIDLKSRGFQKTAEQYKLTESEYDNVFKEISQQMVPVIQKYQELKQKGINLEK